MNAYKIAIFGLLAILILNISACKPKIPKPGETPGTAGSAASAKSGDVTLTTSDNFTLTGTFNVPDGKGPMPAMLLVHQVGKDRTTYSALQDKLAQAGIASLAIDFRGHGQSTDSGKIDYRAFTTNEQWIVMTNDIEAGLQYLRTQPNIDKSRIGIVGASIGANLAVLVAADDQVKGTEPSIACLVLLSPGLAYHGVQPLPRARDLGHMPVYIVSGSADSNSWGGAQSLSQAARGATLQQFNGSAHGTDLLTTDATLPDTLANWIKTNDMPRNRETSETAPQTGFPQPSNPPTSAGGGV